MPPRPTKTRKVPPTGHRLWSKFLEKNRIALRTAAKELGVSHVAVISWRDGISVPEEPTRAAIAVYTRGAVAQSSWLTRAERRRRATMSKVQPFAPKEVSEVEAITFRSKRKTSSGGGSRAA